MHTPEGVPQPRVGVAGKGVQLTHHLVHRRADARSKRPHSAHPERMPTAQQRLRVAHPLKRRLVGGKQAAETGAPLAQTGLEGLLAGQRLGIRPLRAAPQQIA